MALALSGNASKCPLFLVSFTLSGFRLKLNLAQKIVKVKQHILRKNNDLLLDCGYLCRFDRRSADDGQFWRCCQIL